MHIAPMLVHLSLASHSGHHEYYSPFQNAMCKRWDTPKKTPTDKNILRINAHTGQVVYRGPTLPGKTHAKKAVDETPVAYRTNTTLDKDTGFQG